MLDMQLIPLINAHKHKLMLYYVGFLLKKSLWGYNGVNITIIQI